MTTSIAAFSPQPKYNPANVVMNALKMSADEAPGLFHYLSAACQSVPQVFNATPQSEQQSQAVMDHIGTRVKRQISLLRLHHRPYFLLTEELDDAMYCAAAASILPDSIAAKTFGKLLPATLADTGLGDGLAIAASTKRAMGGDPIAMIHAFYELAPRPQLLFLMKACQFAIQYIDLQVSDAPIAQKFRSAASAQTRDTFRATLMMLGEGVKPHNAAMATAYLNMLSTIRKLDIRAMPETARVTQLRPQQSS